MLPWCCECVAAGLSTAGLKRCSSIVTLSVCVRPWPMSTRKKRYQLPTVFSSKRSLQQMSTRDRKELDI
uniref:Secreted protein n=1 Tax=Steinernema glaseri TaxID=37863 RepID=A0A1I7YC38_9BILA